MIFVLILVRKILESKRELYNALAAHGQINILSNTFNQIVSTLLVIFLIQAVNAQIICGMNMLGTEIGIESQKGKTSLKLAFLLLTINASIGVNLVFAFCANVHTMSSKCLKKIQRHTETVPQSKLRMYRRIVRSLAVVKVDFGQMNFIEKLTPVIFQQFSTSRLIDCLLVSKS